MTHFKDGFRSAFVAAVSALALVGGAQAQDYPNRRISFVLPLPPGAASDNMARLIAERFAQRLGQPVIVENKPGAAQFIGADFVARAAPDGYTLLFASQVLVVPREMRAMKEFDPSKLAAIGRFAVAPYLVVVPTELPASTLHEFIAQARANPGRLNYGVVPGSQQLDMIQFQQVAKVELTEVPFNGSAPIVTALLGNQVQMSFLSVSAIPHIEAGRMRPLAATSRNRWSRMPQVPSMSDLGFDFEAGFWFGMAVPAGTPQPVRDRLTRELAETVRAPDVRDAILKVGMEPIEPSAAEMARQLQREATANEAAFRLLKPAR